MNKKKFVTFGVVGLFAMTLISAAVLSYFGLFSFSATILPAITVDGQVAGTFDHTIPEEAPGGELFCFLHKVENKASIDIDLELETIGEHEGVDIGMFEIPETTTLNLCEKDSNWQCEAGATADLTFDTVNPSFIGTLTTSGLENGTDYALIYYPDNEDRFASDKWNGAGGKVIKTFTGDVTDLAIDVDLGVNLPDATLPDWNINPSPNYCNYVNGFDDYTHCRGAKLWIVKTSDLTNGDKLPLVNWNPTAWLFETDLITYSDCDLYTEYVVDMVKTGPISGFEAKSKTMTPMLICYDFDEMAYGVFDVDTKLIPAV